MTIDTTTRTAAQQLRAIAKHDPSRPALVASSGSWTYAELDADVDRVVTWLQAHRTPDDDTIVALRMSTTPPVVVWSMALARAGIVCTSIDPTAPAERVSLLLDDIAGGTASGRCLLVTDSPADADQFDDAILHSAIETPGAATAQERELGDDDLQNVVYTSGSTGLPVGLRCTGRQRLAIRAWAERCGVFEGMQRVGVISAGTLGQVTEYPRMVLVEGLTMHVHDVLTDGLDTVPAWLREHRIELVPLVPTLVSFLLPMLEPEPQATENLKAVLFWGEQASWEQVADLARILPAHTQIHNVYGSTETNLIAAFEVPAAAAASTTERGGLPAGPTVPGVTVRITRDDGTEAGADEVGEILVDSPHRTQGYWNRPELTAAALTTLDGVTYWRTGDAGRIDQKGVLHVAGRLDHIVKVSGHRVSLLEVERAAATVTGVRAAAATTRDDDQGATRLHLYVVGEKVEPRWVRRALARALPPAHLPDTVTVVDDLPTLGNGKLDRKALPDPVRTSEHASAAGPGEPDDLVSRLLAMFGEALSAGAVDPDDDFFELGGDSIRAGRLAGLLQNRLGQMVSPSILFEAPSPRLLAAALETSPSLLLPVRVTGAATPLFVVHGGGGDVWFAQHLADQLPDRPVYALRPPPLEGPTPPAETLGDVAARYVEEIRRVRPSGPYRLFGYSLGGVIAFEMALRLESDGEQVELVGLGDCYPPEVAMRLRETHRAGRRARRGLAALVDDPVDYARRGGRLARLRVSQLRDRAAWRDFEAGGRPSPEIRGGAYKRTYGRLLLDHDIVGRLEGDVVLVRAARQSSGDDHGWGPYVQGSLRVVDIDTDHDSLVDHPAVVELARSLEDPAPA